MASDSFAGATVVDLPTVGAVFTETYSDSGTTAESGEPIGTRSQWWKYTPAHSGQATVVRDWQAGGGVSTSSTHIDVYTGSGLTDLRLVGVSSVRSRVATASFRVRAGTTYYIRSWVNSTAIGTATLIVTGEPTVSTRIPDAPQARFTQTGLTVSFSWPSTPSETWELKLNGGSPISLGAVSTYTIDPAVVGTSYQVELRGTNSFGTGLWSNQSYTMLQRLVVDNFDRATNASVVGAPQVGSAPTVLSGTWGIAYNQLMCNAGGALVWESSNTDVDISANFLGTNMTGTANQVLFGQTSATSTDCWMVDFLASEGSKSTIGKWYGLTLIEFGSFYAFGQIFPDSVCRVIHTSGFVRVLIDDVVVWEGELPTPVLGTRHGFRRVSNMAAWDDLIISVPAEELVPSTDTGTQLVVTPAEGTQDGIAFLYRGRDTKSQDIAGGS